MDDWLHRTPTAFRGRRIFRLGLAANFGVAEDGARAAVDRGVNLFFWILRVFWTLRAGGLRNPRREALKQRRDRVAVIGVAQSGWFGWGVRRGAERLLRELGTDPLDAYLLGWLGVGR